MAIYISLRWTGTSEMDWSSMSQWYSGTTLLSRVHQAYNKLHHDRTKSFSFSIMKGPLSNFSIRIGTLIYFHLKICRSTPIYINTPDGRTSYTPSIIQDGTIDWWVIPMSQPLHHIFPFEDKVYMEERGIEYFGEIVIFLSLKQVYKHGNHMYMLSLKKSNDRCTKKCSYFLQGLVLYKWSLTLV
jgi:hypothetical protein